MKTLKPTTYSYPLVPVLARQLRDGHYSLPVVRAYLASARAELAARQTAMMARQERLELGPRARGERKFGDSCFELEQRWLLFAFQSLQGLEAFLSSRDPSYLNDAMADFRAAERRFEVLLHFRKSPPQEIQEDVTSGRNRLAA